jgi:hypothetical protein
LLSSTVVTIYADNAVRFRAGHSNVKITEELMRESMDEWLTGGGGGGQILGSLLLREVFPNESSA